MSDVLSYRSDHLFRPFLAKNEKYQINMYRKKIRIHLMSSAYRRDTRYNNGFSLFPEEENREVLVSEFL